MKSEKYRFPTFTRLDLLICVILFLSLAALYVQTAGPSLGGLFDSEEYQWSAFALDFAPSTGYPLYLLLGKLWIALVPIGNVAHRMNLLSGLFAAIAASTLYLNGFLLTRDRIAALIGALWLGTSPSYWFQASVAAVSPLHFVLLGLILLSLFLWAAGRAPLELVAVLIGLSLAHHRSTLLVLPAVVVFVSLNAPNIWRDPKRLARMIIIGAVPLLLYLYIPFTADPAVDRGYIINQILNGGSTFNSPQQQLIYFKEEFSYLWQWLWLPGTILLFIGLAAALFKRDILSLPGPSVALLLLFSTIMLAVMPILWFLEIERYATVVFLLSMYWVITGIHVVRRASESWVPARTLRSAAWVALVLALIAWPALSLPSNLSAASASSNDKEYGFWDEIFAMPLEDHAEILVNWTELNAMHYFQVVEGRRRDLQPVRIDQDVRREEGEIQAALERGQPIYLTPSTPQAPSDYHYSALGPLLRVNAGPLYAAPASPAAVTLTDTTGITLLGYGLSQSLRPGNPSAQISLAAGKTVRLGLVWQANSRPDGDYQLRLRLADDRAHIWSETKGPPVRGRYPTGQWQPKEVVVDSAGLLVRPGTPPGEYHVLLDWLDPASGALQPVSGANPRITVEATHSTLEEVFVRKRVNAVFDNRISLVGLNSSSQVVRPGDEFVATLIWRAQTDLAEDYSLDFRLATRSDSTIAEWSHLPLVASLPTSSWRKGDTYQEFYDFAIPAAAPSERVMSLSVLDKLGRRLSVCSGLSTNQAFDFLDQFGLASVFSSDAGCPHELVLFSSASQ